MLSNIDLPSSLRNGLVSSLSVLTLPTRDLRPGDAEYLAEGHLAKEWQSWAVRFGVLALGSMFLIMTQDSHYSSTCHVTVVRWHLQGHLEKEILKWLQGLSCQ